MPDPSVEVIEYTDPGCSWAWGSEPKLRLLQWRYGDRVRWRRVMGGLVGDMGNYYETEFDPVRAAETYKGYWKNVASKTGMPYPAGLRWVYRSTEPACRAVKAAELQGVEVADAVLRRLRESTFVFGEPPDTPDRILASVSGTWGLDLDRFGKDLASEKVEEAFRADWRETRGPNEYVMNLPDEDYEGKGNPKHTEGHWRYVFPTVIVRGSSGEATVPGWKDYERYEEALETVQPGITADRRDDPSPKEFFDEWATAAPAELGFVTGKDKPPKGVVTYDWGDGMLWLTRSEAEARGID